jgi:integrase
LKHKKGRKDETVEAYLVEIDRLETFGGKPLILYEDAWQLDDLIIRLKESCPGKNGEDHHSDRTTFKIATAAKVWLDFCAFYGIRQAPHPYWMGHGFEKGKCPEAEFFDRDEDLQIINRVLYHPRMMLRDRAILWLFFSTGIRRKELCGLNVSDIDTVERWVHIRKEIGKREKWRYVPFDPLCAQVMEDYVFGLISQGIDPGEPLFQNKKRARLAEHTVWRNFDDLANRLFGEDGPRINPKKWRHSLASFLAQHMNSFEVAKIMGHESPQTTMIYYHRKPRPLKQDYDAAAVHALPYPIINKEVTV